MVQFDSKKTNQLQHLPQLDGLRAIAIFLVLLAHFFNINEANLSVSSPLLGPILSKLTQFGVEGVTLFFILSGYLISKILINNKSSDNYFSSFLMRRVLRIFPLYYLILFLSFFIFPLFFAVPQEAQPIIQEQWMLWTYLSNAHFLNISSWDIDLYPNFGHFWTLSVEEHFYLLWPLLIYFIATNRISLWMWFVFIFSLVSWFLGQYISFFSWTTLTYASSLAVGGLIAHYERTDNSNLIKYTKWVQKHAYLYVFLFLIAVFLPRSFGFLGDFIVHILSIIIFSALLLVVIEDKITFLNSQILIFIGKISYGIYVYHAWLRPFFKEPFYENFIQSYGVENSLLITVAYTLVSSMISIFIAWVSWELFEKKILKFKKYFPYSSKKLEV